MRREEAAAKPGGGGTGAGGGGGQAGGGGGGGVDGGGSSDAAWSPETSGFMAALQTPNGEQVTSLAVNPVTNTLYAALVSSTGIANGGIAVFSTATLGAPTATIPPVLVDGGPVPLYFYDYLTAVDTAHNMLYETRQGTAILDVFNGATNAYASTIDVAALDSNCLGPFGLSSVAIDSGRALLYTTCAATAGNNVVVSVFNVASTPSLAASIVLTDLQSLVGGLALDAANQKLFVANTNPSYFNVSAPPILIDTINTANNTEVTNEQVNLGFGKLVYMYSGSSPTAVTAPLPSDGGTDAGTALFVPLEGTPTAFSPTFTPLNYEPGTATDPAGSFWVLGTDTTVNSAVVFEGVTSVADASAVISGPVPFNMPSGTSFIVQNLTPGNPYSYMNGYAEGDGGTGPYSGAVCFP